MRLVITGDSTASDYSIDHAPRTGWGQALAAQDGLEAVSYTHLTLPTKA